MKWREYRRRAARARATMLGLEREELAPEVRGGINWADIQRTNEGQKDFNSYDGDQYSTILSEYRWISQFPKEKTLLVEKELPGFLSDRLQEALWREGLHIINDGYGTTEDLDDAITYGPGMRWALMGTFLTFHLAGGELGMKHMLDQFGPALKLPWTKLK